MIRSLSVNTEKSEKMLAKYACKIARKFKSLLVMNPIVTQVGLAPPMGG